MSEADTPSREEHFFTTDAESEASGYESDVNDPGNDNGNDDGNDNDNDNENRNDENSKRWSQMTTKAEDEYFMLRLSRQSGEGESRPTSVYTIKPGRGSNCSGLSPMPLLRRVSSPSTPDTNMRTFYSDTVSSDEDHSPDAHFCTATPVTYFAPHTRPNLVSISPSLVRTNPAKVTKKTKKHASLSRKSSTDSNRSMKNRISQLRLSQTENKRNSTLIFQVPSSPGVSPTMARYSAQSGSRNRDSASTASTSSTKQWPLSEKIEIESSSRRTSTQPEKSLQPSPLPPPSSPPPPPPPKEYPASENRRSFDRSHARSSDIRTTGYRRRTDASIPLPNTIGLATSSPSPTFSPTLNTGRFSTQQYRGSYRPPPTPPTAASEPPYPYSTSRLRTGSSTPDTWGDPFPSPRPQAFDNVHMQASPPGTPASRERTRSISSMASSSSKFSLPLDAKNMMNRYRRDHNHNHNHRNSHATAPPSSSTGSGRFSSLAMASKSTTNLASYLTSSTNSNASFPRVDSPLGTTTTTSISTASRRPSLSVRRNTGSPTSQSSEQRPLRAKSTKWLQNTGETVSQAGSKAFNGLGSMLRKKTTSPNVSR